MGRGGFKREEVRWRAVGKRQQIRVRDNKNTGNTRAVAGLQDKITSGAAGIGKAKGKAGSPIEDPVFGVLRTH